MKKMTWASSVLAILVLTACGSGGSGSGVSPSTSTGTTTTPVKTDISVSNGFKVSDGSSKGTGVAQATSAGKYTYTYNGQALDLTLPGMTAGTVVNLTSGGINQMIGGTTFSYSRFGAVSPKDQAMNGEVFYMGMQTVNMPTTGSAVYKGQAIGAAVNGTAFDNGPMTFNVNFGNKTIAPTIDVADTDIVFKQGVITGNGFSGTVVTDENGVAFSSGAYSGKFFGPNAEELGGSAHLALTPAANGDKNYEITFSFGGKKQ